MNATKMLLGLQKDGKGSVFIENVAHWRTLLEACALNPSALNDYFDALYDVTKFLGAETDMPDTLSQKAVVNGIISLAAGELWELIFNPLALLTLQQRLRTELQKNGNVHPDWKARASHA